VELEATLARAARRICIPTGSHVHSVLSLTGASRRFIAIPSRDARRYLPVLRYRRERRKRPFASELTRMRARDAECYSRKVRGPKTLGTAKTFLGDVV
jgi:hypothetical protein